jgi:hypothetical protein
MKTLLSILVAILYTFSINATINSKTLIFKGNYQSAKLVKYEVYTVNQDSTINFLYSKSTFKKFSINLEVNKIYLIKFIDQKNKVKYACIHVEKEGEFQVNVDFNRNDSATMTWNKENKRYDLLPVKTDVIAYVRKNSYYN